LANKKAPGIQSFLVLQGYAIQNKQVIIDRTSTDLIHRLSRIKRKNRS